MKKNIRVILLIALFMAPSIFTYAQSQVSALWPLTGDQSVTVSGDISASSETIMGLTPSYEIPSTGTANKVQKLKPDASTSSASGTNTWPDESSYNSKRYVQFSFGPKSNFDLTVDSLSLLIGDKGIKGMDAAIYYSMNSTFSSSTKLAEIDGLTENGVRDTTLTGLSIAVKNGQTLYIRVYPWLPGGTTSTSKYLYIGNVNISATANALPTPTTAIWPDTTDLNPVTSGLIVAKQETFSSKVYSYGFGAIGTEKGEQILTTPKGSTWPAKTNPDTSYYVQYSATVAPGGTLYVDSLSIEMGAKYSNNLKAAVYYSTDSTFTTSKQLVPDTSLSENTLVTYGHSISPDTVATGHTFYIRVYPHDTQTESYAKIVYLANMSVSGYTKGVAAGLPKVSTTAPSYISTTFGQGGGSISSDGGAMVTARGVCWSVLPNPTTGDSSAVDGSGIGTFTSQITKLSPGTKYYVAAYATNIAGTAYGTIDTLVTLTKIVPPTVKTANVSNILAKTAESGGTVTAWGGDTVKTRGICFGLKADPTLSDSYTVDGNGIGSYVSGLENLKPSTTYHIRAYATNSTGTGYGQDVSFKTQAVAPTVIKVVAQDGSGDYKTIQAAFDAVPDYYTGKWIIYVENGVYDEKDVLGKAKSNVILEGQSRDSTILTHDDYSGKIVNGVKIGTSTSYTLEVEGNDFTAESITIRNTSQAAQAVAVMNNGDRQIFYKCNIKGYQDTYYNWGGSGPGRVYNKDCLIEGSVDFMFGRDVVVSDSCIIHENRNSGTLTAASTNATTKFGYVFLNDSLVTDKTGFDGNPISGFYLGRPWQGAPRVVYIHCYEPATLELAGWLAWNVQPALYAEYNCYGPGSGISGRATFSTQLDSATASTYTLANIFSKNTDPGFAHNWIPAIPAFQTPTLTAIQKNTQLPTKFELYQNYPNPFNPTTNIAFQVPRKSMVTLKVYNILGQVVETLVHGLKAQGHYMVRFNGAGLASGVYIYRLQAGSFEQSKELLLLK